jgi:transcriptional regulator with XRE-family HTH domain
MDNKNVIGQRINTALAHFDIKQKELAAYLGVPANTISYFCKGSRTPSVQQIIQMSVFFMVPSDWFLGLLPLDYIDVNDESNKFDTRGFTIAQRNVLGEISDMT